MVQVRKWIGSTLRSGGMAGTGGTPAVAFALPSTLPFALLFAMLFVLPLGLGWFLAFALSLVGGCSADMIERVASSTLMGTTLLSEAIPTSSNASAAESAAVAGVPASSAAAAAAAGAVAVAGAAADATAGAAFGNGRAPGRVKAINGRGI